MFITKGSASLGRKLLYFFLVFVLCLGVSSCSTHKSVTKRSKYEKAHHKSKKEKDREEKEEKLVSDITKHLKGDEKKVIHEAQTWIGTPYQYARQDKGSGTDCSGYTMMVFKKAISCDLPRNSAKQAEFCKKIKRSHVKPGDLVFFATGKDSHTVTHVGIMINEKQFLHASSSKGVVISSLDNNYYSTRLVSFGKVPCLHH